MGSRLLFAAAENAQNRELYLEGFARVSQDFTVRRSISCLLRITRDPDVAFYSRQPTFCRRGKIDLSPAWCVHGARMQRASARALYVDALDAYLPEDIQSRSQNYTSHSQYYTLWNARRGFLRISKFSRNVTREMEMVKCFFFCVKLRESLATFEY